MTTEFKLPELGENVEGGDVVSVLVAEGDVVDKGQNVLELETDKAVVEVPTPVGGKVAKIHVQKGDHINVGDSVLTLTPTDGAAPAREGEDRKEEAPAAAVKAEAPSAAQGEEVVELPGGEEAPAPAVEAREAGKPVAEVAPPPATAPSAEPITERRPPAPAGPATRRLARKLGVDLYLVEGTGRGGRILREDIESYVRQHISPDTSVAVAGFEAPPLPDFSQWGEIERQKLTGIRRKTVESMSVAWRMIPHVTQFDTADITELEAARRNYESRRRDEGQGKLTVTVLAMKACVIALREFPQVNASLDLANEEIVLKRYYHLGIATDTEHGLIVPVVRDVDRKTIPDLASELTELAARARSRKIKLEELQGATFTITNLGGIGGTGFTPIVNHPQLAILGISRARQEYAVRDGKPELRLMMPICLSYDHRAVDGADGARFLRKVATLLSDPFQLMLEM